MKKIAVCFGGTEEMYSKTVQLVKKNFKLKSKNRFFSGDYEIKLFFSFGPRKDELRKDLIAGLKKSFKNERPAHPAEEVVKIVEKYKPDKMLFFGIAGGLNPKLKINDIIYPVKFSDVYAMPKTPVKINDLYSKNSVKIKNLLGKNNMKVLTSNVFFDAWKIGWRNDMKKWKDNWSLIEKDLGKKKIGLSGKEIAKKWCEMKFNKEFLPKLRKFGDMIEMESIFFAKKFKNKIGAMFMISDIPGKYELKRKNIDWKKFNKFVIMNIKKAAQIT